MKTEFGKKIQKIVFGVVCVLVAILLVYLWGTVNLHVEQSRESEGYRVVSDVVYSEYAHPAGDDDECADDSGWYCDVFYCVIFFCKKSKRISLYCVIPTGNFAGVMEFYPDRFCAVFAE